ncbi:hypothetical protein [Yinghuangia soli]|uniref:ABM domain-containing protein n=1 Tax=Yinghuangia soli TaxID=2908204 RepID=A0AA41U0Z5_9ACTN|nr:hypothetical protein [Yinghuangia soli]MCF2530293.1 hypothetical protein [Yinghuangia soli]
MAILMRIEIPITAQQYDALFARLQKEGPEIFTGCLTHVAVAKDGGMEITDLWNSQADMEAFMARMMPISAEVGITPANGPEPSIVEVHNHWVPGA